MQSAISKDYSYFYGKRILYLIILLTILVLLFEIDYRTSLEFNIQTFIYNHLNISSILPAFMVIFIITFCSKSSLFVVFFGLHFYCQKHEKMRLFLRIGFLVVVNMVLKAIIQENRPFWERSVPVPLLFCKNTYGFPDTSIFLFFVLFIKRAWNRYVIIPLSTNIYMYTLLSIILIFFLIYNDTFLFYTIF